MWGGGSTMVEFWVKEVELLSRAAVSAILRPMQEGQIERDLQGKGHEELMAAASTTRQLAPPLSTRSNRRWR